MAARSAAISAGPCACCHTGFEAGAGIVVGLEVTPVGGAAGGSFGVGGGSFSFSRPVMGGSASPLRPYPKEREVFKDDGNVDGSGGAFVGLLDSLTCESAFFLGHFLIPNLGVHFSVWVRIVWDMK